MNNQSKTISKNRQKKEVIVAEIVKKVQKAKSMVFANYQGLTHHQLETLKRALKKADSEFVATKNTLLLRCLADKNFSEEEKKHFHQPTGTLFIYNDIVEPLKQLAKTIKELQLPVVKFGLIEGKIISDKDILRLSTLPPLPLMRAQLLGQMQTPISGLHRALRWNLQSLVMTMNAIVQKKTT